MWEKMEQLGLDESEARVYLALLELGPSTVTEITQKARITRTLGYHVLEKLGWYGLVSTVSSHGTKKKFVAEHPRSFLQFVKNKRKSWIRREHDAERILPDLVSLYNIAEKPVVRYQRGLKGVISIFEESLESKTEILSIFDVESWHVPEFEEWAKGYNRERNRRKIHERILILDTPKARTWLASAPVKSHTAYRWITKEQVEHLFKDFGGELNVYENKVVVAFLQKPHRMCMAIESSVLANLVRAMFEMAWEHAEPVKMRSNK